MGAPPSVAADPPAKEDIQHATAADALPEGPAPADSPAKDGIQSAAPVDALEGGAEAVFLDTAAESGEEGEGDCEFCLYMMGGGCKEEFVGWEKCVDAAEADGGDIVDRCSDAMTVMRRCMDKYPDYYAPMPCCVTEDLEKEDPAA